MKPEDLKKLAEYMGYELKPVVKNLDRFVYESNGRLLQYNPLQNNDQLVELIDKLELNINRRAGLIWVKDSLSDEWTRANTLPEAVVNAALEMIKEKQ